MTEPGWKRNGRNGPLDWWLGCKVHGYDYQRGCMSCSMAEDHNIEFQKKLDRERDGSATYPEKHRCSAHAFHDPECRHCVAQNTAEPDHDSPTQA